MSSVPVDLRERIEVLFWQETTSYRTEDYLSSFRKTMQGAASPATINKTGPLTKLSTFFGIGHALLSPSDQIKEHWREIICEWAYNLVDHFDLPRERVSVFTNLLDRYLQKYLAQHPEGISKKHFQLLSLTCLFITLKMDCQQGYLSLDMMIHLSQEKFSKGQMMAMEKEILEVLEWKLHPPTSNVFLEHFLLLLQPEHRISQDVVESARFFLELAALDYHSVTQRPSRITLAALLNAIEQDRTAAALTMSACGAAIHERQYHFLLCLIAPSERQALDLCRSRLIDLYKGMGEDDMMAGADPDDRMSSPVSVAHDCMHP